MNYVRQGQVPLIGAVIDEPILIGQRHFGTKSLDFVTRSVSEGNCHNVFPRLRFGLLCDGEVALSN